MTAIRNTLMAMAIFMAAFTIYVIANHGIDFVTPILSALRAGGWQGHINVDFALYLILTGIWMAWRHGFTTGSIALGLLAPWLGMAFFAPYLLVLILRGADSPQKLLLGVHTPEI